MNFTRLFDILDFQWQQYPQDKAFSYISAGEWRSFSLAESLGHINRITLKAWRSQWKKGDNVAFIFEHNSPWWNFVDFGLQQLGIITVPIHATATPEEIAYICNETEAVCLLASGSYIAPRIQGLIGHCPRLQAIYSVGDAVEGREEWDLSGPAPDAAETKALREIKEGISENDLATIIYTSGTTGMPKGVMLSHLNIVSNIKSCMTLIPVTPRHRVLSFLPLSHAFERMVVYSYIAVGASIYYATQQDLLEHIKAVKPHYFSAVPRFLERAYDIILARSRRQPAILRWAVRRAVRLGENYSPRKLMDPWFRFQWLTAGLFVYRWWRRALGGSLKGVFVGAASLNPRLGRLFTAAGIRIVEGYGLTETSPVVAFNRFEPGGTEFGTVGIAVPGVEIHIDSPDDHGEGEIWVKGPNVMKGYYRHPEWTEEIMTSDGWLRTGDIGRIVKKRFLQITDRRKDIFKTTHGKYIAPQRLENRLKSSPYISQCMVIGANRPFVAALVVPDFEALEEWSSENGVHWTAPLYMVHNPRIIQKMNEEVARINENADPLEKIRKIYLTEAEWSSDTGELTPTLKNKRAVIEKKYAREIGGMYE